MEEEIHSPVRMVTRGIVRHYAESPTSDQNSSFNVSYQTSSEDDQHSEFHMDSSESFFRAPSLSTRGRKRRSVLDENQPFESPAVITRRGRPRGSTRGRGGTTRRMGATHAQEDADESSLFSMVKSGKNLHTVIDSWIEEYERHPENALVQLQQYFISCCGCKGIISSVMLQTMEYSEIIRQMTDQFDEDSGDYPLVMPGPQWRRFKQNFAQFVMLLITKCKSSYIFDQRMMDGVIQLLTGLADSQVRSFRHTATFAAMKLSSALVDVVLELVDLQEKNARQVETEKAKLRSSGANDRLDVLINKKTEIDDKIEDLRQMLQYIFKSVFVHRYRDILPEIRGICLSELGQWMQVYPQHFLDDSFLKYVGWSLHDKVPDVRLKCITALLPLYERPDMAAKLELFTNKFKNRLVSMVLDKDSEVALRTCQLLTSIYKIYPDVLTVKDCVPIYELVYSSHRGLAMAAGEFLNTKVFQSAQYNNDSASGSNRYNENAKQLILDLIQFYIEGECHEHAGYLVDSLIDTNRTLKDWGTMTSLLLSGEADRVDSELIEVLVCSVKQAATGESPVGRAPTSRKIANTVKDVRQLQEDRTRLSEILIPQLPQLLQRYIADRDKVANLIKIALHFQLDMYLASRFGKHLDDLMDVLESVVEKHADDEVLQNVAEVMAYLSTNIAVAQHTETHHLKMIDGLALQLRHSVQRFHREQVLDEEDEAAMLAAFRKITAFAMFEDLRKWHLWEPALSVLTNADEKQVARDVCEKAVTLLFLTLAWDLHRMLTEQEANKAEAVNKLKKRKEQFISAVTGVLTNGASGVENAYLCLCDTLILFNTKEELAGEESLVNKIDTALGHTLSMFVVDNVFVEETIPEPSVDQQETQVQMMHKRRNILAQYCKLILHGVLHIQEAALVLQFYTKYYTDFGDILKVLLTRIRDMDRLGCAKAIASALCQYYEEIKRNNVPVDPNSDDFASMRELAKRFSSIFGTDQIKSREALAVIHKDGITYALTQDGGGAPNLQFMEILCEFSGRLMRQDKHSILRYLEKTGEEYANEEPYLLYKASLQERCNEDIPVLRGPPIRARGRGRGRGRGTPVPSLYGDD